jgi:hypothetical protein
MIFLARLPDDTRSALVSSVGALIDDLDWWDDDPDVEPEPPASQAARLEFVHMAGGTVA